MILLLILIISLAILGLNIASYVDTQKCIKEDLKILENNRKVEDEKK